MTMTNSISSRRIRSLTTVFFLLIIALNAAVIDFEDDEDVEGLIPEDERQELWAKKFTWPPNWHQETPGYLAKAEEREKEIMTLTGSRERWENWMQHVQSRLVPKFTENGFDVVDVPPHIHAKLKKFIDDAVENYDDIPYEEDSDSIYGGNDPKFMQMRGLEWEVIEELKEYHEQWAGGIKLEATSAYGVRLYQNLSSLVMHQDKIATHVISSIVHIAHKYDNESNPWPLHIEDHHGVMHSVNLEEGQMAFYESAKCLHGRMKPFKGKYYGSVFLHYRPVDPKYWGYSIKDVIAAVPPHWQEGTTEQQGSRWAGQAITVDSVCPKNIPDRIINGKYVHSRTSIHSEEL